MAPPKLLVVNFPINLRCYVLLGCRVINVILAINIGDSAFCFNCWLQTCTLWLHMGLHCHMTKSYKAVDTLAPPKPKSWLRHCPPPRLSQNWHSCTPAKTHALIYLSILYFLLKFFFYSNFILYYSFYIF